VPGPPRSALSDSRSGGTSGAAAERPLNHPPPPRPPPPPSPPSRVPLSPPPSPRSTSYTSAMAARVALFMSPSPALSEPVALLASRPSSPLHQKVWAQSLLVERCLLRALDNLGQAAADAVEAAAATAHVERVDGVLSLRRRRSAIRRY
jgi:hypothetical protein